ncbi:hypothetical protein ABE488_00705 [Luteimonas sp. TWI662]|uniref:hypothetical protein n=1 Tax=Luteimonas sp. TWI662 TaxID=3136789 RepID=UPI00320B86B3
MPPPAIRLGHPIVEDFAYLARRMRPDEIEQFLAFGGLHEYDADIAARAFAATPGPSYVFVGADGLPFLAGGFQPLRPGVFDGWLVGTLAGWEAHGFAITRICRRVIDQMLVDGAHRVQIAALASRTAAHDWYERGLGLQREGVLRAYCADGSDAVMFAKVRR